MLTVRIEHDQDLECPNDNGDGQWRLYSFSDRHVNFKHPDECGLDTIGMRRKLKVGTAFMLSYYEHGNCLWMLANGPHPAGVEFQWDGTRVAGLLVWEHPVNELGPKTYEDRAKDAQQFLETYTAWANGDGYYFCIEDEDGEVLDSCGGFYGPDMQYMIDEYIKPAIAGREYCIAGDLAEAAEAYYDWKTDPESTRVEAYEKTVMVRK